MRLAAADVPLQDLAGDAAATQAEREGQREDQPAEGDAEGDQHHLLADAEVGDRGGAREEQHAPPDRAGHEAGLRDPGVDRRDEDALAEEVRHQPPHQQDQRRAHHPRHPGEHELGQAAGAGDRESIDGHRQEQHEHAPEHDEPEHLGRRLPHPRPVERGHDPPRLGASIERHRLRQAAGDARADPRQRQADDGEREHRQDAGEHEHQSRLQIRESGPHEIAPHVRHDPRLRESNVDARVRPHPTTRHRPQKDDRGLTSRSPLPSPPGKLFRCAPGEPSGPARRSRRW